jgi:hypothetical protein
LAARIVIGNWLGIRSTVYTATYTKAEVDEINEKRAADGFDEMDHPDEWLWMISPEALREMTSEGVGEHDHYEAMLPVPMEDAKRQLDTGVKVSAFGEGWRTLVIHGSHLTQAVMTTVAHHFRFAEWQAMRDDLVSEMDEDERRFRELSELIKKGPSLTAEKAAELKRRFGELRETDFSTNPPTPPSLTFARAKDLILRTDPKVLEPLASPEGSEIEIDGDVLQQLMFLRLLEIHDERVELTLLGGVVSELLRDREAARRRGVRFPDEESVDG